MTIYDPETGIYDHQVSRLPSNDDTLLEMDLVEGRSALFEKIDVREGGQLKKVVVLDAILDKLTAMAMLGDVTASKLRRSISEHDQTQEDLAQANIAHAQSPIRAEQMAFRRVRDFANNLATLVALQMMPDVVKAFEAVHGPIELSSSHFPEYLDPGPIIKALRLRQRRQKKTQPKQVYDVGRGKTPISTRFTATHNPRGRSQASSLGDRMKKSQEKKVAITTVEGKQMLVSRRAAAYRQTFRRAISGKKGSLREAITTILHLDKKGMLSPPDRDRRMSRKPAEVTQEAKIVGKVAEVITAPAIKRELVALFTRKHGAIPDFITGYEGKLPRVEDIKGWDELQTKLAERVAKREPLKLQAHEIARNEERVSEAVIIPSRPRARTRMLVSS